MLALKPFQIIYSRWEYAQEWIKTNIDAQQGEKTNKFDYIWFNKYSVWKWNIDINKRLLIMQII